jgi:hypothetical protein
MIANNRQALMTKPLIIIVIGAVLVTMISASLASMTSAQQPQTSGSKFGTIGSLQFGNSAELIQAGNKYPEIKVPWILSGGWEFKNINSSSPTFNATLQMVMTNGTDPHSHIITDFKMTGSPIKKGIATTYNGTATMSVRPGYIFPNTTLTDVPISIKLMGPNAMSLWIDPTRTVDHFGRTPIYGVIGGATWPAMKMH